MGDSPLFDFEGLLEFPNLHSVNNQNTFIPLRLSLCADYSHLAMSIVVINNFNLYFLNNSNTGKRKKNSLSVMCIFKIYSKVEIFASVKRTYIYSSH